MISIIIPTLNEEKGIVATINSIPKDIRDEHEIIVVDVSNDQTPRVAEGLGAKVLNFSSFLASILLLDHL